VAAERRLRCSVPELRIPKERCIRYFVQPQGHARANPNLSRTFLLPNGTASEGDDRKEKKLDLLLRKIDPENAEKEIEKLDRDYSRT
jgi:hypothetical protein